MLKPAIFYTPKLQERFAENILKDSFKYYSRDSHINMVLEVYHKSEDKLQFVSVDDENNVVGYFGCRINRETDTAYDLEIINFGDRKKKFAPDLVDWVQMLRKKLGIKRIVWWVIVGNPAEKLYDRIVNTYGGRVVGVFTHDAKLRDGQLYDVKWYELFTEQANDVANQKGITKYNYRERL